MIRILAPIALAAATLAAPAGALAQTAPAAPTDIDPARLAEARKLIAIMMPPAMRDRMIDGMIASIGELTNRTLMEDPSIKKMAEDRPGAREAIMRFVERQQRNTMEQLRANFPQMTEAMARAYARRFTVVEMREMGAFFATPTGQRYISESATIFSDPDVAGWLQGFMRSAMERAPDEAEQLRKELEAL